MKSHTYAALAEAVEVGLYRGWDLTHRDHAQPRKDRLLHGLLTSVMAEVTKLINESGPGIPDDEGIVASLRDLAAYRHSDVSVAADAADLITALLEQP